MSITLSARARTVTGKKVKTLRREGLLPAVLFGHNMASQEISVSAVDYSRLEHKISASTLIDISLDGGAPLKALLHKVQKDPRSAKPIHLELFQVRMEDKIRVEVPIHIEGAAPAVSQHGGTLVVAHNSVEIRCSPDHLMNSFHVDVSSLATFDDHITVGDIPAPEGVEFLTDPETILVSVLRPSVEAQAEEVPLETAALEQVVGE